MSREKTKRKPTGSYEVGYCKPPVGTRFKKGTSGNDSGRPPKHKGNEVHETVLAVLGRKVRVRKGEQVHAMPAIEAIMERLVRDALEGKTWAVRLAIQMWGQAGAENQALSQAFLERALQLQASSAAEKAELERRGESTDQMDLLPEDVLIDRASGEAMILRKGLPDLPPPRRELWPRAESKRRERRVRGKTKAKLR